MAARNYYVILGVGPRETPAGIRSAFRDLAKRYHPDHAGPQSTETFKEICEAYEALADPARRKLYDDELRRSEPPDFVLRRPEPAPLFAEPQSVHPSFEETWDRFVRNYTGVGVPKAEHAEPLVVEVVLTPEEAALGGTLPVGVPVIEVCPACGGTGRDWFFPCLDCLARGLLESQRTVRVRIPPFVRPGAIIEAPLGLENFYLRVHISISGW